MVFTVVALLTAVMSSVPRSIVAKTFLRTLLFGELFVLLFVWQQSTGSEIPPRTVLVLGDSLSAGYGIDQEESWVALLRKRLKSEGYGYGVVNTSISGDTTTSGLRRLPRALSTHRPAVVIIELGGNDGLRATPLKTVRQNLLQMIKLSRDAGARVVLAGMQIPGNYGPEYTQGFAAIYPELARSEGVALVKFFLDGVALDASQFQEDGIHPTAGAQPKLLDNVWPVLKPFLDAGPKRASGGTAPKSKASAPGSG